MGDKKSVTRNLFWTSSWVITTLWDSVWLSPLLRNNSHSEAVSCCFHIFRLHSHQVFFVQGPAWEQGQVKSNPSNPYNKSMDREIPCGHTPFIIWFTTRLLCDWWRFERLNPVSRWITAEDGCRDSLVLVSGYGTCCTTCWWERSSPLSKESVLEDRLGRSSTVA